MKLFKNNLGHKQLISFLMQCILYIIEVKNNKQAKLKFQHKNVLLGERAHFGTFRECIITVPAFVSNIMKCTHC